MVISAINRNHHKELSLTFLIICGMSKCTNACESTHHLFKNDVKYIESYGKMHGNKPKAPQESHTRSHLCFAYF